jgi:hypothetical protein
LFSLVFSTQTIETHAFGRGAQGGHYFFSLAISEQEGPILDGGEQNATCEERSVLCLGKRKKKGKKLQQPAFLVQIKG